MTLLEFCITYKNTQYYVWARSLEVAEAIAIENFKDALEIDATGETKWEFDDYYD